MKRKEFVRQLKKDGCLLLRSGGNHDIYFNPKTGLKQPVPRHKLNGKLSLFIKSWWFWVMRYTKQIHCLRWF